MKTRILILLFGLFSLFNVGFSQTRAQTQASVDSLLPSNSRLQVSSLRQAHYKVLDYTQRWLARKSDTSHVHDTRYGRLGTTNLWTGNNIFPAQTYFRENAAPTNAPEINFEGYRTAWKTGIDVANNGGGTDFVMLADVASNNTVRDLIYVNRNKTGSNLKADDSGTPSIGFFFTPASSTVQSLFNVPDVVGNRTVLGIRKSASQTGKLLDIFDSNNTSQWWIDAQYNLAPTNIKGDLTLVSTSSSTPPAISLGNNPSDISSNILLRNKYTAGQFNFDVSQGATSLLNINASTLGVNVPGGITAAGAGVFGNTSSFGNGSGRISLYADGGSGQIATTVSIPLILKSNTAEGLRIFPSGNIGVNTITDDTVNKIQTTGSIKASQFRLSALNTAPTSATDTGTTGELRFWTSGGVYYVGLCVATNTWVRTALTTW